MKTYNIQHFIQQFIRQEWWLKIQTQIPACTYYFGPFDHEKEAKALQMGYIDDLVREGAQGISLNFEKSSPQQLTVPEEE